MNVIAKVKSAHERNKGTPYKIIPIPLNTKSAPPINPLNTAKHQKIAAILNPIIYLS
jgi:hypothetical protein